jgi:hypothetical protein
MLDKAFVTAEFDKPTIHAFTTKIAQVVANKKTFVAAFTGSSITDAGDCAYNQSYAFVFGEMIRPITQALGVDIEVRNVAQGNNPIVPYDLCVESLVGDDVDFVSWEQQLNCPNSVCVEVFVRNVLSIPSKPLVGILEPGVNYNGANKLGRIVGRLIGAKAELLEHYSEFGMHMISGSTSFLGKDGATDSKLSISHLISEGKQFGNAGWHPGPYGHKLLAYYLAYNHGKMWVQAAEILHQRSIQNQELSQIFEIKDTPDDFFGSVDFFTFSPSSKLSKTYCSTVYEPRYNPNFQMANLLVDTQIVDLRSDLLDHDPVSGKWVLQVHPQLTGNGNSARGSLNRKYAYLGNKDSGSISFKIEQTAIGPLAVCQPKFKPTGDLGRLQDQANILIDGKVVSFTDFFALCLYVPEVSAGSHTITVQPLSNQRVMVSHILWA